MSREQHWRVIKDVCWLAFVIIAIVASLFCILDAHADNRGLGTAVVSTTTGCPSSALATTYCLAVLVSKSTVADKRFVVKVTEATGPRVGSVVILAGGSSTGFSEATGAGALQALKDVRDGGAVVLQAAADSPGLLFGSVAPYGADAVPDGLVEQGVWASTMYRALYDDSRAYTPGTWFEVTGNSGGGVQVGLAMFHYKGSAFIDCAVPTSMAICDLQLGCHGNRTPGWPALCAALRVNASQDCEYVTVARDTGDDVFNDGRHWCQAGSFGGIGHRSAELNMLELADLNVAPTAFKPRWGNLDTSGADPQGRYCTSKMSGITETTVAANHDMPNTGDTGFAAALLACTFVH